MLKTRKIIALITTLLLVFSLTGCSSMLMDYEIEEPLGPSGNYIGVVEIHGEIGPSADTSSLFATNTGYDHTAMMDFVDEMMEDDDNEGILLSLDTPGGTVYESDELYLKLMEYKEETGRPIYAYMHSMAASGGYYISMAADEIYANRNTTTGSIGVMMGGIDMSELYEKVGLKEQYITSGPNKAMGSSGTPMTEEQIAIFQSIVDEAYDIFVDIIVEGRGLKEAEVRKIADGRVYTAKQALDLKLIDGISLYDDYLDQIAEDFDDDIEFYTPTAAEDDFMSLLLGRIEKLIPKSDAEIFTEFCEENSHMVPMYYYGG